MSLNLDELTKKLNSPLGSCATQALGIVFIYSLRSGQHIKLLGELKTSIEKTDIHTFTQVYLKYVLRKSEGYKESLDYTADEVSLITKEEIEKILQITIDNSDYLTHKTISKTNEEDGKKVINIETGEIKYPKLEGESNEQYFYRLMVESEKSLSETMKKMYGRFNFSNQVAARIRDSFPDITKLTANLNVPNPQPRLLSDIGPITIPQSRESIILEKALEELKSIDERNAKIQELNVAMLIEMKGSSDDAKKSAKYALIGLYIAAASFLVSTILQIWTSYNETKPEIRVVYVQDPSRTNANQLKTVTPVTTSLKSQTKKTVTKPDKIHPTAFIKDKKNGAK